MASFGVDDHVLEIARLMKGKYQRPEIISSFESGAIFYRYLHSYSCRKVAFSCQLAQKPNTESLPAKLGYLKKFCQAQIEHVSEKKERKAKCSKKYLEQSNFFNSE